jgi:hypothetical protein
MSAPVRTGTRTMDTIDLPARSGSNVSGEESSGSSGTVAVCSTSTHGNADGAPTEDRVRKFQRTTDHGSRLRKASASNAMSAARPPPATSNPALRGRSKGPLGPRERPQDFSKPRYAAVRAEETIRETMREEIRRVERTRGPREHASLTCDCAESPAGPAWLPSRVAPSCPRSQVRPPRAPTPRIHASASPSSPNPPSPPPSSPPEPMTSCPRSTSTTSQTASPTSPP